MADPTWLTKLFTRGFPTDRPVELQDVTVNAGEDHGGMIAFISRIPGLYDALRKRQTKDGPDPLNAEDPENMYYLLLHVHEARMLLQAQEERVILACKEAGVTFDAMATALSLRSRQHAHYRYRRVQDAAAQGRTCASLDHETGV